MLLNGVRNAAIARRGSGAAGPESSQTLKVSLRQSVAVVSDPRNLDETVEEVFQMMLGVLCRREDTSLTDPARPPSSSSLPGETQSVTAVVGFGGLLSGACVFRCGSSVAIRIAALMTGMEFDGVDGTVKDAIGEIGNMLAGAWKGRVPDLSANCGLSVPAVISGSDYNLHVQAPEFQLHHTYCFEEARFDVTIVCDGLQ